MRVDQQWHGYRRGHQLLASTVELAPRDQDLVDKLSDASGSPRPGEAFEPYLTIYPLSSGRFHVVARTWQDREASRSGTVFTRSLLVPTEMWRSTRSIRPFFDALADREVTDSPAELPVGVPPWRVVDRGNIASLTEALFLEPSAAIAAFGFDATETITGRVAEALWPARRAVFAACTFVLGPRSLREREFDLVFAPESARSRFAKWTGRKITATSPGPARHAWTDQIARRIFEDREPRLAELDEIGALGAGSRSDGSSLRLALLWADLERKLADAPTSLLGMFDVLASLGRRPWDVPQMSERVVDTLRRLPDSEAADAWRFLQLLVRKLGDDVPLRVLRQLFRSARDLSGREPRLVATPKEGGPAASPPHLLLPAVARGLADLDPADLAQVLRLMPPSTAVALMGKSPRFATAAMASLSAGGSGTTVADLTRAADDDRRAARRSAWGASRGAQSSIVAPFLRAALQNSPADSFAALAGQVLAAGGTDRDGLLDMLVELSRSISREEALREAAVRAPVVQEGDRLLADLTSDRAAATWLVEALEQNPGRLHPLLLRLMDGWSDGTLREAVGGGRNKDHFLEAALAGLPGTSGPFLRLLSTIPSSPQTNVAMLSRVWPRLGRAERSQAGNALLEQILSLGLEAAPEVFASVLASADPARILSEATSTSLPAALVGRNIGAIASSPSAQRFVSRVDVVTSRLAERRSGGLGPAGYAGWARLLRLARRTDPEVLLRSADAALEYSLPRLGEPAGAVVAATFPIVHARLRKDGLPEIPLNMFTAFLIASLALFTGWDRAKSARHGLVDAFLKSSWEPVELLRAGVDAGISRKVLGYLVSNPGGREYLRRIERSVGSYPDPARQALADELARFKAGGS